MSVDERLECIEAAIRELAAYIERGSWSDAREVIDQILYSKK